MDESYQPGERVEIWLDSPFWGNIGWLSGTIVSVEPYSQHRSFFWVQLDASSQETLGKPSGPIAVLNPRNIRKIKT